MGYMCLFPLWLPRDICRSGINGSYGGFIPSIFKESPYHLPEWLYQFTFPPTVQERSLFSTLSPAFIVCRRFDDGRSDQCEVITHCSFICVSLVMNNVEHLFMYLLAICMSSLEKCLFRYFPCFFIGWLFFWHWVVWSACIFWKLFVSCFICYYFLPFWGLSFHLAYSFICYARAFTFNQVPIVYFCFYFHYSRRWVIEDLALIYIIKCSAYVFPLRVL